MSLLRRYWAGLVVVLVLGGAVLVGYLQAGGDDATFDAPPSTRTQASAPPTKSAPEPARELFGHECGTCHTLADAGVTGGVGPNLDEKRPSRERVLTMIRNGSLDGAMPANLLTGREAERVASYVANNAGR